MELSSDAILKEEDDDDDDECSFPLEKKLWIGGACVTFESDVFTEKDGDVDCLVTKASPTWARTTSAETPKKRILRIIVDVDILEARVRSDCAGCGDLFDSG